MKTPLVRKLIRTDGTTVDLEPSVSIEAIRKMIGADTLATVNLHHMGHPLHVMLLDDCGWEFEVEEPSPGHFIHRPTRARKPVNVEATRLYHLNCKPGTQHQIVGDVVIMPDEDEA